MSPPQHSPGDLTRPIPTPTKLPIEIICHILTFLPNPELGQSAQLSHACYEQATRILYRYIRLALWSMGDHDDDPDASPSEGIRLLQWPYAGDQGVTPRILSPPYTGSTLRDRFALTESLTIFPHSHLSCSKFSPLTLPNLVTLRIMPVLHEPDYEIDYFLNVCRCPHIPSYYDNGNQCTESPSCLCPLLTNLRPRRVIFGGTESSLHGAATGLWATIPPPSVEEIVVIVGVQTSNGHGISSMELLFELPDTVNRLTLVMSTWMGRCEDDGRGSRSELMLQNWLGSDDEGDDGENLIHHWLKSFVALACTGGAGVIEVVGWETVNPEWSKEEIAEGIEDIRETLRACLLDMGWKEAEAGRRAAEVAFVEGEEYLTRDGDTAMRESRAAVMAAVREDAGPY